MNGLRVVMVAERQATESVTVKLLQLRNSQHNFQYFGSNLSNYRLWTCGSHVIQRESAIKVLSTFVSDSS